MILIDNNTEGKVTLSVQEWFKNYYQKSTNKPYLAVAGRCGVNKKFYYSVRFPVINKNYISWPETFFSSEWHQTRRKINNFIGTEIEYIETSCLDIPSASIYDSSNVVSILSKRKKNVL